MSVQSPARSDARRRPGPALARNWDLTALCGWTALWFVILAHNGGIAWKYFVQGSLLMFTGHDGASAYPGGLHIYANYPQLQIGPLAFSTGQLIRHLGPDQGLLVAEVVMTAMASSRWAPSSGSRSPSGRSSPAGL